MKHVRVGTWDGRWYEMDCETVVVNDTGSLELRVRDEIVALFKVWEFWCPAFGPVPEANDSQL